MFKDRFDRLMAMFRQQEEGKKIDAKSIFHECLFLFEELKHEIKNANPEERQDMMRMVGEMYKEILAETQKVCKESGMNEEQLMQYAENPSNFTPEQWETIQDSRAKIHKAGQSLIQTMEKAKAPQKEVHPHTVQPIVRKTNAKRAKKSGWQRS